MANYLSLLGLLLLLWSATQQCAAVCQNMGEGECHGDTCSPGQYCSDANWFEGCRNCTHLTPWCPDVGKLERDYPQCVYVCDLKTAHDKIEDLETEVLKLTTLTQSLRQTISQQNSSAARTENEDKKAKAMLEKTREALTRAVDNNALMAINLEAEHNATKACDQRYFNKVKELERASKLLDKTRQNLKEVENQKFYLTVTIACGAFIFGLLLLIVSVCLCQSRYTIRQLHQQITTRKLSSIASSASEKRCCWPGLCLSWIHKSLPSFRYVAQPNPDQPSSQPMLPLHKAKPGPTASTQTQIKRGLVQPDTKPPSNSQPSSVVTYAFSHSNENFVFNNTTGKTNIAAKKSGPVSAKSLGFTTATVETQSSASRSTHTGNNTCNSNGNNTGNTGCDNNDNPHTNASNVCSAVSLVSTVASTESNGSSAVSSDSGNSTGSNNSGDGCPRKMVAPTGDRTEHEHGDRQDFMTVDQNTFYSSQRPDLATDSAGASIS